MTSDIINLFDYATLKWFGGCLSVLLIGFAIMDGHIMGIGTLLPPGVKAVSAAL